MFNLKPDNDRTPLDAAQEPNGEGAAPISAAPSPLAPAPAAPPSVSVLASDLSILGERVTIISQSKLRVEGQFRGDVHAREVVIEKEGSVTGEVWAERIDVMGEVNGSLIAVTLALHDSAKVKGAVMHQKAGKLPDKGFWFQPTFFTNVTSSSRIAREEIFGPVLSVMTFRTPEEAIEKANNTPYGLSAGVWTDKGSKAMKMANALRAGVVWINTFNKFDPASPFGGYKESGYGREGGKQGLLDYCKIE